MKKVIFSLVLLVLIAIFYFWRTGFKPITEELDFLSLPEGFKISVAAKDLDEPRVITFDAEGRMLVSETKAGRVSILDPPTTLGTRDSFENKRILINGLKSPHGIDFYKDAKTGITYLYIAETHQVARYSYDIKTGRLTNTVGEQIAKLPADGRHFTRTIAFGSNFRKSQIIGDNSINTQTETKLYISVGSSCDVCVEDNWKRAAILESDPEGSFTAEFAGGLRNSVFFTFHPETKEIWATEMGRDNLGDNLPPDEVNIVKVARPEDKFGARRYGWPFCYGNQIKDKTFSPAKVDRIDIPTDCHQTEPAAIKLPAHSAPLGLAFISNSKWPKEWQNNLLVAVGHKIVRFKVDTKGKISETADFITGWSSSDKKNVFGRLVDLKFGPDGALYISDDASGNIYRVTYH